MNLEEISVFQKEVSTILKFKFQISTHRIKQNIERGENMEQASAWTKAFDGGKFVRKSSEF